MAEVIKYSDSASIFRRFGDELIKDPYTAFFELIKNSYDADATEVIVKFHKTTKSDGSITISDNGSGMDKNDIKNKWARAGGENKVKNQYSKIHNRRMLGRKGIGRFSVSKLGDFIKVTTRPKNSKVQYVFCQDMDMFTDDRDFHEMELHLSEGIPRDGFKNGTIIEISRLRNYWKKNDIKKVKNQLAHLIDPENKDQNFRIKFECNEFTDLSGIIKNPISGKESHKLEFSIDNNGGYEISFSNGGKKDKHTEVVGMPSCGSLRGIIRYYKEGLKKSERNLDSSIDESHMGIKVYRDGCRVRPYGESTDDWLDVKGRRSKSGGKFYIQSNNIAGSIYISAKENPDLEDSTNREAGIIENESYKQFREFVIKQIEYLNKKLEQETKSLNKSRKRQTLKKILDTITSCLNKESSDLYNNYVKRIDRSKKGDFGITSKQKKEKIIDEKKPDKMEWNCNDCNSKWRTLKDSPPAKCMENAVNRKGEALNKEGCGSSNISRSTQDGPETSYEEFSSLISGEYAYISGRQIRIRIDYDLGENDDEVQINEREIVLNGNHLAFAVAEKMDGISGKKYEIGDETFVPALTIHISKCACSAWAELHYKESKNWEEYRSRFDNLQQSIFENVMYDLQKYSDAK